MAIKLDNLFEWRHFKAGTTVTLRGAKDVRRIRLNVNSPDKCPLYIVDEDGEILRFLATAIGCDVIEFWEGGDVTLTHNVDDVYLYTADNDPDFNTVESPEVFTKIAERAPRNHEFEMMMHQANLNAERRFAMMQREMDAKYERQQQEYYSTQPVNPGTNASGNAPVTTGQAPNGQSPAGGSGQDQPAPAGSGSGNNVPDGNSGDGGQEIRQQSAV